MIFQNVVSNQTSIEITLLVSNNLPLNSIKLFSSVKVGGEKIKFDNTMFKIHKILEV